MNRLAEIMARTAPENCGDVDRNWLISEVQSCHAELNELRLQLDESRAVAKVLMLFVRDYEWGMGTSDELQSRATALLTTTPLGRHVLGSKEPYPPISRSTSKE